LYQQFEKKFKKICKFFFIVQIAENKLKLGLKFEFGNSIYMLHFEEKNGA
jgi:hypothetical protein